MEKQAWQGWGANDEFICKLLRAHNAAAIEVEMWVWSLGPTLI